MQFEKLMAIAGVTGVVHPIANTCNRVTPLNITTPREAPFQLPGGGGAGPGRRGARKLGARTSARHMYNINYYTYVARCPLAVLSDLKYVYVQCHVPVGSGSDVGTD